jgi:hypothetical protein
MTMSTQQNKQYSPPKISLFKLTLVLEMGGASKYFGIAS